MPEVTRSPTLSLLARPGDGSIKGRKVALLVADGANGQSAMNVHAALFAEGAVPRFVGPRIGPVKTSDGVAIDADASLENEPGFLFDALVLPDGDGVADTLAKDGHTLEFIRDQHRHCKAILVMPASDALLQAAGVAPTLPSGEADPGIVQGTDVDAFIDAMAKHRHFERETDPPMV